MPRKRLKSLGFVSDYLLHCTIILLWHCGLYEGFIRAFLIEVNWHMHVDTRTWWIFLYFPKYRSHMPIPALNEDFSPCQSIAIDKTGFDLDIGLKDVKF